MINIVAESPPQHEDGSSSDVNPLESAKAATTENDIAIDNFDQSGHHILCGDPNGLVGAETRGFYYA